uniref:Elongation factor EFG domain-containing protein n=1 Tax=Amphimedon queenslandica TaxID=400682 RepID=A0A1X7UNC2_AMPQE
FISCSPEPHTPVIVFISKMFLADLSLVRETQTRKLTLEELKKKREALIRNLRSGNTKPAEANEDNNEDNIEETVKPEPEVPPHQFLAFSRVFSGTLRKGQKLFVLQPRYDPTLTSTPLLQTTPTQEDVILPPHVTTVTITKLYLMMGRDLLEVESVASGNVAGIGGLGDSIVKSGTLSSSLACTSFRELQSVAFPIVHVALEAVHFSDLPSLDKGLELLDQSDPCVRCTYQETGERILSTAGEVHLQRCLDDLRNVYAGVELKVSPPIVPFRETVIARPTVDMVNEIISSENELIGQYTESHASKNNGPVTCSTPGNNPHLIKILATPLPETLIDVLDKSSRLLKILTSMGGASYHGNEEGVVEGLQTLYEDLKNCLETADKKKWNGAIDRIWSFGPRNSGTNILLNKISSYERPSIWRGVVNQDKGVVGQEATDPVLRNYDNSIISGFQLASLSGPLCEEPLHGVCFEVLEWTEPTSEDESEQDTLRGPVSGQLISVVKECCRQAMLAQPTRLVAPMYSCIIQVLPSDPFWVPSTEMELEHYGEKADTESQARIYMNSVRKRKGLAVDEKIVEHAEKQRTLKRNK